MLLITLWTPSSIVHCSWWRSWCLGRTRRRRSFRLGRRCPAGRRNFSGLHRLWWYACTTRLAERRLRLAVSRRLRTGHRSVISKDCRLHIDAGVGFGNLASASTQQRVDTTSNHRGSGGLTFTTAIGAEVCQQTADTAVLTAQRSGRCRQRRSGRCPGFVHLRNRHLGIQRRSRPGAASRRGSI